MPIKSEDKIVSQIWKVEQMYQRALNSPCATVLENAPLALMQLEAKNKLDALYWVLGKKRPRFGCDKPPKKGG